LAEPEPTRNLPLPALAGMMLAASLAPLGSTMMAVAVPAIASDLGRSDTEITQWLVAGYLITNIALQSPGGKLGDLISHTRALLLGLAMAAAGSAIGYALAELPALVVARVLMAAGGAATVPAAMAILRNSMPHERRARAFGFFGACMGIAAAVGPLVGGALMKWLDWRAVFAANLPVIAISMALLVLSRRLPANAANPGPRPKFDWLGSLLIGAGLGAVLVALRLPTWVAIWVGLGGAALLALFAWYERRVAAPVVDFTLFKRTAFFAGGTTIALQNLAMYAMLFQLPIFFDKVRGLEHGAIGPALLALTLAMVAASVIGGRLSERIGARLQVLVGSLLALGGLWWVHDFSRIQTPLDVIPGLLLMGTGIGLSSPPAQAASMSAAPKEQSGMAGGVLSTMRYMGGVAGIAALGALLTDAGDTASHGAPVIVYASALIAAAALSLLLPGRVKKSA
jgi:MFS family permease